MGTTTQRGCYSSSGEEEEKRWEKTVVPQVQALPPESTVHAGRGWHGLAGAVSRCLCLSVAVACHLSSGRCRYVCCCALKNDLSILPRSLTTQDTYWTLRYQHRQTHGMILLTPVISQGSIQVSSITPETGSSLLSPRGEQWCFCHGHHQAISILHLPRTRPSLPSCSVSFFAFGVF
jgi:hypothetical protein